ncbi:hypothetical protein Ga0100230_013730 [Opitutaceae bacterium TAV3]|nr:hypothetical protein Ga0100230_013730 [Opitutaceae bacterium TAV3]
MEPRRSFYRAQSPVAKPLHGAPKVHLHLVVCFPRCRRAAPRRSAIRAFFQRGENMTDNTLSSLIGRFFTEHLRAQRNLSAHTIASYRDTFRLLLQFLPAHLGVRIEALALQSLSTGNILAFLDHLERSRKNSPRTRNYRLAAIRSFARYVLHLAEPDSFAHAHRILSIPLKRSPKSMFGYFSREEMELVLATPINPHGRDVAITCFSRCSTTPGRASQRHCKPPLTICADAHYCCTAKDAKTAPCHCGQKRRRIAPLVPRQSNRPVPAHVYQQQRRCPKPPRSEVSPEAHPDKSRRDVPRFAQPQTRIAFLQAHLRHAPAPIRCFNRSHRPVARARTACHHPRLHRGRHKHERANLAVAQRAESGPPPKTQDPARPDHVPRFALIM